MSIIKKKFVKIFKKLFNKIFFIEFFNKVEIFRKSLYLYKSYYRNYTIDRYC